MTEFDPTLDVELVNIGDIRLGDSSDLHVSVRSYNGGSPTISTLKRWRTTRGVEGCSSKLPRLNGEQGNELAKLMQKAAKHLGA